MEPGKYFEHNQKKLDSIPDADLEWVKALKKCKKHVIMKLRKRTLFGAHTEERLAMDPVDYYVSFAYEAVLDGNWEWKDGRTLGQQLVRIADNRIGKEVEKFKIEENNKFSIAGEDIDELFFSTNPPPGEPTMLQEILFNKQVEIIEEAVKVDENMEMFWECVKDGMKRDAIAAFLEKKPKQVDKIREKIINKIKGSGHFELE